MSAPLRFVMFGGCAVLSADGEVKGAATQQRRLALLAVLARGGERGVSRSRLLQLFWPDEPDEDRRRKALAQAIYALRRDLGDEGVINGTQDLRLDAALLPHDVGLFTEHLKHGRHADAVTLYQGPFLGGFHLAGAPAFERWAEEERRVLERDYVRALESLATSAEQTGQFADAVQWRRRAAAVDPLDSRATLALMQALAANGEIASAIRQASIHETLVQQELELPPDREVVAYAANLRTNPPEPAPFAPQASSISDPEPRLSEVASLPPSRQTERVIDAEAFAAPTAERPVDDLRAQAVAERDGMPPSPLTERRSDAATPRARGMRSPLRWVSAAAVALALAAGWLRGRPGTAADGSSVHRAPTSSIAVGLISDFRADESGPVRSLAALLATSLARSEALRVVSAARIGELLHQGELGDTTEAAYMAAARRAGVEELIDGSLYDPGDGALRLDLRRVDVSSGAVLSAVTIRARDLFALADSGTVRLLDGFGVARVQGSVRDVTTRSEAAHRLYAEGLRANASYDTEIARRLFGEALREDSLFAMAAFEFARANPNRAVMAVELERALGLARRATARERLIIQGGWASVMQFPGLRETADSLLRLDPDDPQALLFAAEARLNLGLPSEARPLLERVMVLDSSALRTVRGTRCYGCDAVQQLVRTYFDLDDPESAVRTARQWVDMQPRSGDAWATYARALDFAGRIPEAIEALERTQLLAPGYPALFVRRISILLRDGRMAEAESLARVQVTLATEDQRLDGWWQLSTILRHQGRMQEALAAVNGFRAVRDTVDGGRMALNHAYLPAHILYDAGRVRASVALFDSMATGTVRAGEHEANVRRLRTSALVAAADYERSTSDTLQLLRRLSAVERAGRESGVVRDTRAHHFVRGLLMDARGRRDLAVAEWQAAIAPPLRGYHSRANVVLARALMTDNRPDEAIRVIRPIMRDVVDGVAVTLTEMHEVLALAHRAAGRTDSARVHAAWVERAWARGEPAYRARARALTMALGASERVR